MKIAIFLACGLGLISCKDNNATPSSAKPVEAPVATPLPATAGYSPAAAAQQLAAIGTCSTDADCKPMETLVGFGASAGPALIAFLDDSTKPIEQRRIVAIAIGKLALPEAGPKLVALGNAASDYSAQTDFYKAAGACGGDATFTALTGLYAKQNHGDPDDHLGTLRQGLAAFQGKTRLWATERLSKENADKGDQVKYVDLITDLATDREPLIALLPATKDQMAKHRLASKAIQLGADDPKLFDVLIAGLASDEAYVPDDAGDYLEPIAAKIPADRKAKVIALIKKQLAMKSDPMLQGGLQKTLAALGGA